MKGTNFAYLSATQQNTKGIRNFMIMALRIIFFFPLILIFFSCVENLIFIQIHPEKQTYMRFESKGDSLDIFNSDFIHPHESEQWFHSYNKIDTTNNWLHITEGSFIDSKYVFIDSGNSSLGYRYEKNIVPSFLGVQYEFHLIFMGTMIKTEFPSLYDAIISKNLDSLYWLPEALTILMEKGLSDMTRDSLPHEQIIWNKRLVNHMRNSFAKIDIERGLQNFQKDRVGFLKELLTPFSVDENFPLMLAQSMEFHEHVLRSKIDLNDDTFIIKLIMPGQIVSTNATNIIGDTLVWNFGIDSLLNQSYMLKAKSTLYATARLEKILISIGVIAFLLIGYWLKKYRS